MTDYQLRNGQGNAFPKTKIKESQPDFQGEIITPSGERFEISMWKKLTRTSQLWFSISIKEPFKKEEASRSNNTSEPIAEVSQEKKEHVNLEDDLPF